MWVQRDRSLAGAARHETPAKQGRNEHIPEVNHCGAGTASLTVDPYGTVYPCVQWRRELGNVRQTSLPLMWASSLELARVRQESRDVKQLLERESPGIRTVGFCPGVAEQLGGNAAKVYPQAEDRLALSLALVD